MYVYLFLYFKEVKRHNRFYLSIMADTDSDSEIQFNIDDVDEEGQGDMMQLSPVPRLNLDDPDDVPRRESPLTSPIPALVPEPQVVRDQRARDRPNEMFASMYSNRSPDRRHEAGDHFRSRSAGARFFQQRYIKKVQVGKDQEKAQSEKDSHSKNRGGKKPNQQSGTYTIKHIVSRMSSYFPNRWPLSYLNLTKNMKTYIKRQQHKKFFSNTKT